jgi:hypothetical protein
MSPQSVKPRLQVPKLQTNWVKFIYLFILPFYQTFQTFSVINGRRAKWEKNFLDIGDGDVGRGALMDWGDMTQCTVTGHDEVACQTNQKIRKKKKKKKSWTPLFSPSCRQKK